MIKVVIFKAHNRFVRTKSGKIADHIYNISSNILSLFRVFLDCRFLLDLRCQSGGDTERDHNELSNSHAPHYRTFVSIVMSGSLPFSGVPVKLKGIAEPDSRRSTNNTCKREARESRVY